MFKFFGLLIIDSICTPFPILLIFMRSKGLKCVLQECIFETCVIYDMFVCKKHFTLFLLLLMSSCKTIMILNPQIWHNNNIMKLVLAHNYPFFYSHKKSNIIPLSSHKNEKNTFKFTHGNFCNWHNLAKISFELGLRCKIISYASFKTNVKMLNLLLHLDMYMFKSLSFLMLCFINFMDKFIMDPKHLTLNHITINEP